MRRRIATFTLLMLPGAVGCTSETQEGRTSVDEPAAFHALVDEYLNEYLPSRGRRRSTVLDYTRTRYEVTSSPLSASSAVSISS